MYIPVKPSQFRYEYVHQVPEVSGTPCVTPSPALPDPPSKQPLICFLLLQFKDGLRSQSSQDSDSCSDTVLFGHLWRIYIISQPSLLICKIGMLPPVQKDHEEDRNSVQKEPGMVSDTQQPSVIGSQYHQPSFQLVVQSTFRNSELQNAFLSP